jgi:hypothetical protein
VDEPSPMRRLVLVGRSYLDEASWSLELLFVRSADLLYRLSLPVECALSRWNGPGLVITWLRPSSYLSLHS